MSGTPRTLAAGGVSLSGSNVTFVIVAIVWFVPDRRFEALIGR